MDIRSIQNGNAKGLVATVVRIGLRMAAFPYAAAIGLRNRRFDQKQTEIHKVDVPVVCIGNLTVGGTGKTPIVCHLAQWLRQQNVRVAIISRGYRSDGSGSNDEAKEMAEKLPDVPQVQNADRFAAATTAVDELESEFLLMDDGFQHRRLNRDLDILVIDSTNPFGFGHLLPRGLLREPVSGLARAGVVLLTRCDLVSDQELEFIHRTVSQHCHEGVPCLRTQHATKELFQYDRQTQPIQWLQDRKVVTVCAIGNPTAFEKTVQQCGATILDRIQFPDHDDFGPAAIASLVEKIKGQRDQVEAIICTHKDLVKIQTDRLAGVPLMAISVELTFRDDPGPLYDKLTALIGVVTDPERSRTDQRE
ncbi:Tetraacyldisaccharide 4'-kinase [Rubripirellula obstinata]|uniref:Tetraacyldisaccharide 4'-kinase n=1 Tax=Rubripirellula obstinata TaxID=406547 RepID=A0A5B1CE36_9BACT|nr:tetraacyldisaccharide 4'-kinase [Rubripirellula obstinata]KAA1258846.1 Tetraacyldisaccharide 4'-kinase [Rubripirellula obstinata]